ncbi:hypothetical protein HCH_04440 [Hahella chejuensis KCTC 2396]|uniref:Uncharacterized protein n=1 Tax=Hahella chejuensis (strain KCTC 2396) TaxID=349521 RepID=Q2SDY0_HAHCH|nr:hypothetical protein [Hahella chejuensis]ABC31144.1 hypothetical protein HCH_04440 [Hahella chejuensis KCTC 2396]
MIATTKEKWIAENYVASRSDNGAQYIDQEIYGSKAIPCDIRYPHGGEKLEGVVSKAETMDEKWRQALETLRHQNPPAAR